MGDVLLQHEAFLRAIYDAPEDDTPRLVYADFLEENGEPDRAEFIRVQCQAKRFLNDPSVPREDVWPLMHRGVELQRQLAVTRPRAFSAYAVYDRGFPLEHPPFSTQVHVEELLDTTAIRERAVAERPVMFTVGMVRIIGDRISTAAPLDALFGLAVFSRVVGLDLQGREEPLPRAAAAPEDGTTEYVIKPTITGAGVDALARHRGARRLTALDLRNNNLDNDAARALVKSPYLDNIRQLQLLQGNRLRGRVWQQVIERFGEDVVG